MKKIFTTCLLFVSIIMNAQETEFTFNSERGMTDFIVTAVENKTAPEIYKKIIEWIKITYKSPDNVILSEIENEYIRFEGIENKLYSERFMGGQKFYKTKYQIEISIKDGKYKFDLISMACYYDFSPPVQSGWYENKLFNENSSKDFLDKKVFKSDGSLRSTYKYINEIPVFFNALNKSIYNHILNNIKKSDDW